VSEGVCWARINIPCFQKSICAIHLPRIPLNFPLIHQEGRSCLTLFFYGRSVLFNQSLHISVIDNVLLDFVDQMDYLDYLLVVLAVIQNSEVLDPVNDSKHVPLGRVNDDILLLDLIDAIFKFKANHFFILLQ